MQPFAPSNTGPDATPQLDPAPPAGGFGVQTPEGAEAAAARSADAWTPFEFSDSVGFWPRAGARIIDMIVTIVISSIGAFVGALVLGGLEAAGIVSPGAMERTQTSAVGTLVGFLAPTLYDSIAEAYGGATLGKLLLGYRVCRPDGRRPSIGQALGRNLAYFIDSLFFAIPAYRAMKSSPLNQRLGDKWAGTVVVRRSAIMARAGNAPFAFSVRSGVVGVAIAGAVFGAISVAIDVLTGL